VINGIGIYYQKNYKEGIGANIDLSVAVGREYEVEILG
jgi:hypothetical protein